MNLKDLGTSIAVPTLLYFGCVFIFNKIGLNNIAFLVAILASAFWMTNNGLGLKRGLLYGSVGIIFANIILIRLGI